MSRRLWETHAVLDYGDHGMGAARQDPRRSGYLELGEYLRWIPGVGEGWRVRTDEIEVVTPKPLFGHLFDGVEIEHWQLGEMRIRALAFAPGTPLPTQDLSAARRTGMLRKRLLAAGARERVEPTGPEELPPLL